MSANIHLKLASIPGSSEDKGFEGQIDVKSFSWGMRQPTDFKKGTGGGVGSADVQDLSFKHQVDKATPKLMISCCKGDHLADAVLVCSRAGGSAVPYLTITLSDVIVSSVVSDGNGAEVPTEVVTLAFAKYTVEYQGQDNKGNKGPSEKYTWNVQKDCQE